MRLIIIFATCFFTLCCNAQCNENIQFDSTTFCKTLNKKADTIYFNAKFHSIGKVSQTRVIQKLISKGYIDKNYYKTAVNFTPIGSFTAFYLPYKDADDYIYKLLYTRQKQNQTICIRGVIIRGFEKYDKKPFFLLDKIWFEKL